GGERPKRTGNADEKILWQDILPASGDDRWIAVSLHNEADRSKFRSIVGEDPAVWSSVREDHAAAAELQAAGIAAGVVQDAEDMLERDPQLAAREALATLDHPLLGAFGHIATPVHVSRDVFAPYRAPRL